MKKLRALILLVIVLALTSFGLPVRDVFARLSRRAIVAAHKRGNHRHCKHTRAWWRRHRRLKRERQARLRRERKLRLEYARKLRERQLQSGRLRERLSGAKRTEVLRAPSASASAPAKEREVRGPRNPFEYAPPRTWKLSGANGRGALKFDVKSGTGKVAGAATFTPFEIPSTSAAQDIVTPRTSQLGGVPLPVLRRAIIEKMIASGGWVTNDFVREIEGRRVYVVTAQTGESGVARSSLTFYFTEIEGRLYNLSTNSPVEFAAPVAADSEQFLAALRSSAPLPTTAKVRE